MNNNDILDFLLNNDKPIVKEINEFSKGGRLLKTTRFEESGKVFAIEEFKHGKFKQTFFYYDGLDYVRQKQEREYYDEGLKLRSIKDALYDGPGHVFNLSIEEFGIDGAILSAKETTYDGFGNVTSIRENEYVDHSTLKGSKETGYDGSGKVKYIRVSEINQLEKTFKETTYDGFGSVTCIEEGETTNGIRKKRSKKTAYDGSGNVTRVIIFEREQLDGWQESIKETTYDGSGKVTDICVSEYGKDGLREKKEFYPSGKIRRYTEYYHDASEDENQPEEHEPEE